MGKRKKAGRVKSRAVRTVGWETGGTGGSGEMCVRERGGRYYVGPDEGGNPSSRHDTLQEAVKARDPGRLPDEGVAIEIISPVLSPEEMADLLDTTYADYRAALILNGEVWVYADGF